MKKLRKKLKEKVDHFNKTKKNQPFDSRRTMDQNK